MTEDKNADDLRLLILMTTTEKTELPKDVIEHHHGVHEPHPDDVNRHLQDMKERHLGVKGRHVDVKRRYLGVRGLHLDNNRTTPRLVHRKHRENNLQVIPGQPNHNVDHQNLIQKMKSRVKLD